MLGGLDNKTIGRIQQVFGSFPEINQVILYGSRAKGNFKSGSDIDLTLIGENISLRILNKIENILDDLLLPNIFDVSIYHKIENQELKAHIERVGKTLFQKKVEI